MTDLTLERHEDARGVIEDLLIHPLDGVTRISTVAGAVRGEHIHHHSPQWAYVTKGRLRVAVRADDGKVALTEHGPGELIAEPVGLAHAWVAIEDAECLVFRHGPATGEGYESDTERLPEAEWLLR